MASGRNTHRHGAAECRHCDFLAENGLPRKQRQINLDIIWRTFDLREYRMRLHANPQKKIPRWCRPASRPSLPLQPDPLSFAHAFGNRHVQLLRPGMPRLITRHQRHASRPAPREIFQGELDLGLKVGATGGLRPSRAAAPARLRSSSKQGFEEVTEVATAKVLSAGPCPFLPLSARRRSEIHSVLPLGAELVVLLPLLRIAQNVIGFIDLFEFLLGCLLLGVGRLQVGMVLSGKLPISVLNVLLGGSPRDSQDLIVIAKFHSHTGRLTIALSFVQGYRGSVVYFRGVWYSGALMLAVITGGSRGIGESYARQLAARGYNLYLVARDAARLSAVAREIRATHRVLVEEIVLDLAQVDGAERLYAEVRSRRTVPVDVLVNNAGFGFHGEFADMPMPRIQDMLYLHLVTVTKSMRLFLPEMRERRSGTIINVASVAGFLPLPYISLYAATKAFMISLGASIGREAQAYGVIVQTCCPGQTVTDFHATAGFAEPRYAVGGVQTADEVVSDSLAALDHPREPLVTGLRNRLLVQLLRILPRGLVLRTAARHLKPS